MSTSVLFDISSTVIALVLVITACVMLVLGRSLPDTLVQWTWIVIGAHFGIGGVKGIVTQVVNGMGVTMVTKTPDLGAEHPPTEIQTTIGPPK